MPQIKSQADIAVHMDRAEALNPRDFQGASKVIGTLMSSWPNDRGIYLQLQRLADFITKTRQELAILRPGEVKQEFILKAADELDAITEGTASATHRIMDAADVLMEVAGSLEKDKAAKVTDAVMSIYEACTFQDITGQRVTKVVSMLKVIEERIDSMVIAMGDMEPDAAIETEARKAIDAAHQAAGESASTLHGPALPGQGTSQSDIDRILAGEGT